MRKFVAALALLAAIALIATFPIRQSFASRAQLIQRVEPSAAADLFGDAGTPIGSPQMLIIDDASAFLPDVPGEARRVDETKLREKGIYPLQLQTVDYLIAWVRGGAGAAMGLFGLGWVLLGRRRKRDGG